SQSPRGRRRPSDRPSQPSTPRRRHLAPPRLTPRDTDLTGLTAKQARFVAEYLKDLNAKQAAVRAGYRLRRAEITGSELLHTRKVSEAVAREKARQLEAAHLEATQVLERLRRLAFSDV